MSLLNQPAPTFTLITLQGGRVSLADYSGRSNILLWFSRGFQCPFCRAHIGAFSQAYQTLRDNQTEVIQVAPNLLESARLFFRAESPPFPFVCDPDKYLYARYGLGDRGVLEATRNTFVAFSTAAVQGEFSETVRGSWLDVMNRNFIRRLHHHALTAIEQGLFLIDKAGLVRHQIIVKPLDPLPDVAELQQLITHHLSFLTNG